MSSDSRHSRLRRSSKNPGVYSASLEGSEGAWRTSSTRRHASRPTRSRSTSSTRTSSSSRTRSPSCAAGSPAPRDRSRPSRNVSSKPRATSPRPRRQNEKLVSTIKAEREKLEALKEEVEKLSQPPASFGVFLGHNEDETVDVFTAGRKMRVSIDPELDSATFHRGAEVILNEALNIVEILQPDKQGEVVTIKENLGDGRVVVVGRGDEEMVAIVSQALTGELLRAGDPLLLRPQLRSRAGAPSEGAGRGRHPRGDPRHHATRTSAASVRRSRTSRTPSSCRSSTRRSSRSTSSRRRRAFCCTALPDAARR